MNSKDALSGIDLHRMLASGAQLAAENSRLDAEKMRGIVNQQQAEIAYLKAQIAMAEAARLSTDRIKQAENLCRQARNKHDALSDELSDAYDVNLKAASFDPESGVIHVDDAASA